MFRPWSFRSWNEFSIELNWIPKDILLTQTTAKVFHTQKRRYWNCRPLSAAIKFGRPIELNCRAACNGNKTHTTLKLTKCVRGKFLHDLSAGWILSQLSGTHLWSTVQNSTRKQIWLCRKTEIECDYSLFHSKIIIFTLYLEKRYFECMIWENWQHNSSLTNVKHFPKVFNFQIALFNQLLLLEISGEKVYVMINCQIQRKSSK